MRSDYNACNADELESLDNAMDVATLWDGIGRVLGIAFLVFMLWVLVFPGWRDSGGQEQEQTARERAWNPTQGNGVAGRWHWLANLRTRHGGHS